MTEEGVKRGSTAEKDPLTVGMDEMTRTVEDPMSQEVGITTRGDEEELHQDLAVEVDRRRTSTWNETGL